MNIICCDGQTISVTLELISHFHILQSSIDSGSSNISIIFSSDIIRNLKNIDNFDRSSSIKKNYFR